MGVACGAATSVRAMSSKPLGPYSPFVRAGDFVIVSGQGGMRDGALVEGGVSAQTTQTMANVADRLAEAGAALGDVVKTLCFLTDMGTFGEFNDAYAAAFARWLGPGELRYSVSSDEGKAALAEAAAGTADWEAQTRQLWL